MKNPQANGRHLIQDGGPDVPGSVMVNIQTCSICNYETNIRGDMTQHRKKYHGPKAKTRSVNNA